MLVKPYGYVMDAKEKKTPYIEIGDGSNKKPYHIIYLHVNNIKLEQREVKVND